MDWEGKISASQLACAASGRVLEVGEAFFSCLLLVDGQFVRRDYAREAWPEVDLTSIISWWKQKVPVPDQDRRPFRLNAETLAQIFANLKDARSRLPQCLAYVVALALVRARKLHFVSVETKDGATILIIEDRRSGVAHRVRDPAMTPAEEAAVLDNLLAVAGGEEADGRG
jgi:hypothetical protein